MWSGCLTASQGCKEDGDFWFIPMRKLLGVVTHHSYWHMYIGCSNSSISVSVHLVLQCIYFTNLLMKISCWYVLQFGLRINSNWLTPVIFFLQHFSIMITTTFLGPPYGGCWGSGTWWCIAKSLWMAAAFPVWRIPYTDICLKWHSSCIGHRSQCCPMVKDVDPGAELFASYWWFQARWPQHNRAVSIAPLGSCALFISAANAVFPKDISSSLFYSSWCLDECVITLKNIRVYCPCDHLTVFHC